MPATLCRLVYFSKNRIDGGPGRIAAEVNAILAASRRNNPRGGITGALVFNRGIFAQVLEGPPDAVEALFERIQQDPRHGDVQVLSFNRDAQRLFPNWSMAYLGQSREDEDLFGHIGRQTGFSTAHVEGERLLDIIRTIAVEEESRAA